MKKLFAFSRILLIVAVLFGLWGVLPVERNVQAATITVCSSGCDYTTIQAAVNAAQNGDVIEIKTGTYTSGTINIAKSLTIKGIEDDVVIEAGSSGGYGLEIQANNFTIENVKLQNNNNANYGLKISGSNNVTVKDVEVTGFARSGVDLIGCNTASIENVNSHDNGGVGIAISNSTNITLNGITTSDNVWGGVGLFTNKDFYTGNLSGGTTGLDGIDLQGTNSFGEANPLYTELADASHVIRNFTQTEFSYVVKNTALPLFTWYQKTKDSSLALINDAGTTFKTTAAIQQLSDGSFYVFDTMKIQPAIDLASANGYIYIYPGGYDETASSRYLLTSKYGTTHGPHQFGLFIAEDKNGISLIGVDDDGIPIDNYSEVKATIATNATNTFGYSGIFVEADDVTIQGLRIGKNNPGDNKTIEVIGDNFTLKNSQIDVEEGGSVYINDWRFDDTTQTSHVKSYYIEDNWFKYGSSVDIASGAGYSGDIQNRRITGNRFTNDSSSNVNWALVSFNGFGEVPWFTKPIGGAIVQDNEFSGSMQYIRARSNYDNTQFNWKAFWEDNTFDKAVVTLSDVENFDVRAYSYASGSYNFTNVRRIGAVIQGEADNAYSGDTILAKPGQYTENITINKPINLIGSGSGDDSSENTILRKNTNSAIITLSASGTASAPILLKDLRIEPVGVYGINVPIGSVEYITLENVNVVGSKPTNDTESEVGFKVATSATLRYLTVENSGFDNLHYGWYFAKHGDWTTNSSTVENVFVQNTTFKENAAKGIYVEKLSKATFTNVIVEGNGWNTLFWNARWNAGFDINLKGETGGKTYQDLVFNNLEVRNNAKGTRDGAGLMIKARDDGPTYSQFPATLSNVQINNGVFEGNERGIRFGEPDKDNAGPTNVVIQNAIIRNNLKTYSGTDGSAYGGVINYTQSQVRADNNYWGTLSWAGYATVNGIQTMIYGDVDWQPWRDEDLADSLDIPAITYADDDNAGKAEGDAGANGGTFGYDAFATIEDALNHVAPGGTVLVGEGNYSDDIPINKAVTITGQNRPVLDGRFRVYADDVTIEGFEIQNGVSGNGAELSGVYIENGQNVTIRDNHLIGTWTGGATNFVGGRGILTSGNVDNLAVDGNIIEQWVSGLYLNPTSGSITVRNNEITNNWAGAGTDGQGNVQFRNNYFRNNIEGIGASSVGASFVVEENAFIENGSAVSHYSGSPIQAERNWWGSPSGPANSANPGGSGQPFAGNVDFAPWLCDGTDSQPDQIGFQPAASAATCTATSEATRLVFVQYPDGGFENVPFATQPVVRAEDDDGNLAVNFNGVVILYLANNPAGGALQGSLVTNAVNGVAAFSGVSISKAGENYQLAAIAASLEPAVSGSFNVQPQNADLAVSINASPNPVASGAALTYTVGVQNLGPLPASNLTLTVNLPDGVTFINAGGTGWTCSQSGGVVTCTRFSLDATSSAPNVTITVNAPDQAGSITATASIEADTLDLVSDNNSASVLTLVVTIPETGGITIYLPLVKK